MTSPSPRLIVLRLKAFGGLSVAREAGPVEGAGAQKRRMALLALLDAAGDRGLSRDKLLGLLWPDGDPDKARGALAQALYAIKRDLGREDLFLPTPDVRLNLEAIGSDRREFLADVKGGRLEDAVARYAGPYLDGFYLSEAPEFERWVETERASLAHDYAAALERLAEAAEGRRDLRAAVGWRRRLAAADPLNSAIAVALMKAMAASGDRAGALQHARVYEELLRQELDSAPDARFHRYVEAIKTEPAPDYPTPSPGSVPAAEVLPTYRPADSPTYVTTEWARVTLSAPASSQPAPRSRVTAPGFLLAGLAVLAALVVLAVRWKRAPAATPVPIIAVGRFEDYTSDSTGFARPLADMLATNLARARDLQVISTARMYELLARPQQPGDSNAAFMAAARRAGATELMDGALYRRAPGVIRLDLRRTDLASGKVGRTYTIEGKDLFALVEDGTRQVAADLQIEAPRTSLADVTTHSATAYRLYEEGLRSAAVGRDGARELFQAALREDSTFAMAAYQLAKMNRSVAEFERALRLAAHTTDRERLLISAGWAEESANPLRTVYAESLVTRYPAELQGYLTLGHARIWDGDFLEAIALLGRVVHLDTASLRFDPRSPDAPAVCLACQALAELAVVYELVDSFPAAERVYRGWAAVQPGSVLAWGGLGEVYYLTDQFEKAMVTTQTTAAVGPNIDQAPFQAMIRLRAAEFAAADQYWQREAREGNPAQRSNALQWLLRSYRTQGRLEEARQTARAIRAGSPPGPRGTAPWNAVYEAEALLDAGQPRAAAAIYDSIARLEQASTSSERTSDRIWAETYRATALAAANDTVTLGALADSVAMWGPQSGAGRDRRAHHHIRGLLLVARGRFDDAERELRAAIFSPTNSYTMTNVALATVLLRLNRPADAAAVSSEALRGQMYGMSGQANRTMLHLLAAEAFDAAGKKDSAVVHYGAVVKGWAHADPVLRDRFERARNRLAALTSP